ncbi:MAG: hemolysin family channel protein [Cyanobacteria bacterium RYN_339]|nr:hemolysin family channel protein [Cyanobacteria bacterium RYN_339]
MRGMTSTSQALRRFRDPVNGFLHFGALLASLVGAVLMWVHTRGDWSAMVYVVGMAGCFVGSSLHHLVVGSRQLEMRLLKLDHAAIYPYIAGSYTPICIHKLPAPAGLYLLAAVWAIALGGIVYKLGFAADQVDVNDPPGLVDTLIYIAMGWLSVTQIVPLIAHSAPGTLQLMVAAGAAYSLGGLILARKWFDFWPGRFGHHEIWHVMVIIGSACVYAYVWINLA